MFFFLLPKMLNAFLYETEKTSCIRIRALKTLNQSVSCRPCQSICLICSALRGYAGWMTRLQWCSFHFRLLNLHPVAQANWDGAALYHIQLVLKCNKWLFHTSAASQSWRFFSHTYSIKQTPGDNLPMMSATPPHPTHPARCDVRM